MSMTIWMAVTNDNKELPVAIADTARELALICGTSQKSIQCSYSRYKTGRNKTSPYRKVVIDDEE